MSILPNKLKILTETKQYVPTYEVIQIDSNHQSSNQTDQKKKLKNIIKKHRLQSYINTFRQKIKRNNIYQTPANFQLNINNQASNSWLHIEGIDVKNKSIQSFIFAGDIIFSLIIFYIAVFQAFIESFRDNISNSISIIILKVVAIAFQFSKVFLKSIKKDIVNGKSLTHIDDILWYSTGILDLILYSTAISLIILTMIYPLSYPINVAAFIIAAIKLFKIPVNLKILDLHYVNSHRKQSYWDLAKVILFELIFMHFVAGLLLAISGFNNEQNWMITHNIQNQTWDIQYFWAMYWSATLITTTGFGDYVATNEKQAFVVAFLQLFSSVVLAYNLNLIGTIVLSLRRSDQSVQKKLGTFRRMTNQSPVSLPLEQKILSYISYEREVHQKFEFSERVTFLSGLPEQLKAEYENDVNQTIFKQLPFFCNLRLETLNNFALQFTNKVCYPGENLIPCRQDSNRILILKRGEIGLQFHKFGATFMNGCIIENIITDQTSHVKPILLNNTFMNRSRDLNFDIVAKEYSLIMILSEEKFMEIIRKSDIEKEHFFTIFDKHESNFIFQSAKCLYCNDEYHNKFQCPKLHYIPFRSHIIRKFFLEFEKKQYRVRYLKTVQRKEHCYYLRRQYYRAYEGYKNIVCRNNMNPVMLNRLMRMKTFAQQFDSRDLLQSFEDIFRKVISENRGQTNGSLGSIDVDVLHDFLSYFPESNPKDLDMRPIKKIIKIKPLKLSHKLTLLATNSKKFLYRPMNEQSEEQFEKSLFQQLIRQF